MRALLLMLAACANSTPMPLSNRVQVSPLVQVEAVELRGEYACSFFHYWPVTFGGCWWVP
jgi:hypothetical protein